jgi:hypothetical protein
VDDLHSLSVSRQGTDDKIWHSLPPESGEILPQQHRHTLSPTESDTSSTANGPDASPSDTHPGRQHCHQSAQAAHGIITFYNAAPYAQIVTAGTLLTEADDVQIVTDTDAVIPAAVYPLFGQSNVQATSIQTGPAGNIRAGDI